MDDSSRLSQFSQSTPAAGTINLFKASGSAMINDGTIDPAPDGLFINQNNVGAIDLDGADGNGRILLRTYSIGNDTSSNLTIHGSALTDSFSGSILMLNQAFIDMDLTSGWTADSRSQITIVDFPSFDLGPAELRGAAVTLGGTIDLEPGGHLTVTANATLTSTVDVTIASEGSDYASLEFEGTTIVNGGTYTLIGPSNLYFLGPTTISGGTFNTPHLACFCPLRPSISTAPPPTTAT
jgi:hypothetical protein